MGRLLPILQQHRQWSDSSAKWKEFPHVKSNLNQSDTTDGSFWMAWADYCQFYSSTGIIDCDLNINGIHLPPYENEDPFGPIKSAGKGCCHYWCKCAGPLRFFLNHAAKDEEASQKDFDAKFGIDATGVYWRFD